MDALLQVFRFQPERDQKPHFQTFELEVPPSATVLDALIRVKETQDGTLSFRRSCRSSICGSCGVRVNRVSVLGCKTRLAPLLSASNTVRVEPLANLPIIKDLVVDLEPFWEALRAVTPWIEDGDAEDGRHQSRMTPEKAAELSSLAGCILCGCCYSSCPVVATSGDYLGPAALAKAYRFLADPRDRRRRERLDAVSGENGVWRCHTIFACTEDCPKKIGITEAIQKVKGMAVRQKLRFWER